MKKIFVFLIAVAVCMVFLNGCDDLNTVTHPIRDLDNRFERMYTDSGWYDGEGGRVYYRDAVTDVVYIYINKSLSPLLHEDGTPYLWSEIERGE